jgi:hypothetical protein
MSRKQALIAALAIALAGAFFYFSGGHQTPSGQPPLQSLTTQNIAEVKNAFNAATDDIRVLLLLSPT